MTRLIVDREREIKAFQPQEYWSIEVTLTSGRKSFLASFYGNGEGKVELHCQQETEPGAASHRGADLSGQNCEKIQEKRTPAPPHFITSTLQQEASRKLSMTAKRTMMVAQELYEGVEIEGQGLTGLITYAVPTPCGCRTTLAAARDYIGTRFGGDYLPAKPRHYKTKKSAQTPMKRCGPPTPSWTSREPEAQLDGRPIQTIQLIWSRFTASQMTDAT